MTRTFPRFAISCVFVCLLNAGFVAPALSQSRPIDELPMYGGVEKNQAQREADRAFIQRVKKFGYTHEEGAKKSIALGWRYFGKGDMATAMKRFNQAWLLNPDNPDVYHGFAVVTYVRDRNKEIADQLFRRAIKAGAKTVGVFADYGRFLGETGRLKESVEAFRKAIALSPRHLVSHQGLILSLARLGRYAEACDQMRHSSTLGLKMNSDFISSLSAVVGKSCVSASAR